MNLIEIQPQGPPFGIEIDPNPSDRSEHQRLVHEGVHLVEDRFLNLPNDNLYGRKLSDNSSNRSANVDLNAQNSINDQDDELNSDDSHYHSKYFSVSSLSSLPKSPALSKKLLRINSDLPISMRNGGKSKTQGNT